MARPTMAPIKMMAMPAAQANPIFSTPQFFFSTGKVVKKKETLREREDRRRELSKLMEQW